MIDRPVVKVTVQPAEVGAKESSFEGTYPDRCQAAFERWLSANPTIELPPFRLHADSPENHIGLGVGTQLTLAVATALSAYFDCDHPSPSELALQMGRGVRSSVGSYGFWMGGFILDAGIKPNANIAELGGRFDFPQDWHVLLMTPRIAGDVVPGSSGSDEKRAFAELPAVKNKTKIELARLASDLIIPSVTQAAFDSFCDGLFEFNRISGGIFEEAQGGAYNGKQIEMLVSELVSSGFKGVGQSSWGPTLFSFCESKESADARLPLARKILDANGGGRVTISKANNCGVKVTTDTSCRQ